jgi:hypothetical protein
MPNITLSVDDEIIRKVRKIAVDRQTTHTEMVRSYLTRVAEEDTVQRELALVNLEAIFRKHSREMGPRTWTRDDLHER